MNRVQRMIVALGVLAAVGLVLYPPFVGTYRNQNVTISHPVGRFFIGSPPDTSDPRILSAITTLQIDLDEHESDYYIIRPLSFAAIDRFQVVGQLALVLIAILGGLWIFHKKPRLE